MDDVATMANFRVYVLNQMVTKLVAMAGLDSSVSSDVHFIEVP